MHLVFIVLETEKKNTKKINITIQHLQDVP